ncbi:MAG: NADH dehydrogenase [Candidatus Margulisbacteria bacterium GWF2_35_9]|nr:MAG: NADH dehydrogenase [Candidatus Margulisbacteria bacterium GWF2_35_9]
MTPDDPRYAELTPYIEWTQTQKNRKSFLIPVLHKTQELFGYLPQETMDFISVKMQIPTSRIYGVATFYHFFSLKPKGKNRINVCLGTACYVKGANDVVREFEKELEIKMGETDKDMNFSLECTRCIGACGLAPVVLVNDKIYSKVNSKDIKSILKELKS